MVRIVCLIILAGVLACSAEDRPVGKPDEAFFGSRDAPSAGAGDDETDTGNDPAPGVHADDDGQGEITLKANIDLAHLNTDPPCKDKAYSGTVIAKMDEGGALGAGLIVCMTPEFDNWKGGNWLKLPFGLTRADTESEWSFTGEQPEHWIGGFYVSKDEFILTVFEAEGEDRTQEDLTIKCLPRIQYQTYNPEVWEEDCVNALKDPYKMLIERDSTANRFKFTMNKFGNPYLQSKMVKLIIPGQ